MSEALITYKIATGVFLFLAGLLFSIRTKYYKRRKPIDLTQDKKAKIDWMRSK